MTERKPPGVSFEAWTEAQIRHAIASGAFDNLPGAGEPLKDAGVPTDENWWLKGFLSREEVPTDTLLPLELQLRREAEGLRATAAMMQSEDAVRKAVDELNARIRDSWRTSTGPLRPVKLVDVDRLVEQWRSDVAARQEAAEEVAAPADPPAPAPGRRRGLFRFFR